MGLTQMATDLRDRWNGYNLDHHAAIFDKRMAALGVEREQSDEALFLKKIGEKSQQPNGVVDDAATKTNIILGGRPANITTRDVDMSNASNSNSILQEDSYVLSEESIVELHPSIGEILPDLLTGRKNIFTVGLLRAIYLQLNETERNLFMNRAKFKKINGSNTYHGMNTRGEFKHADNGFMITMSEMLDQPFYVNIGTEK